MKENLKNMMECMPVCILYRSTKMCNYRDFWYNLCDFTEIYIYFSIIDILCCW